MSTPKPQRRTLSPLTIVFCIVFLDLLGFGILIPVIPQLLTVPQSPDYLLPASMTVTQGYVLLGWLTASYALGQFIANPVLGQLSDRYGRRKILAICLAGTALSYVVFAYAILTKNIPLLFASRLVDGVTGGNIAVAQAVIADTTDPKNRAKSFGLIGAAFGLGFVIGPFLGGKLADPTVVSWFNAATPFWFAAILGALNWLAVLFFLPETNSSLQAQLRVRVMQSFINIATVIRDAKLRSLLATGFFFQGGFTFFTTFAAVFFIQRFSFSIGEIADYYAWIGTWIAISQAAIVRLLAKKYSEAQVLRVTIITMALIIMSYLAFTVRGSIYLVAPVFAAAVGLTNANLSALVSRSAAPEERGKILGINSSVQALSQAIPAALSGYIAASLAVQAPIFIAAITIAVAWLVFLMAFRFSDTGQPATA
jgi:MFS transporter, DHA1 family, tetracycline resistance protein